MLLVRWLGGQLGYLEMQVSLTKDALSSNGFAIATEMVFTAAQQGNAGALNDFWSGFIGSEGSTDFSSASTMTSTFWVDGVGSSIKYSARTARDISNAAKVAPFFKTAGVVGNLAVAGLTLAEGYADAV